MPKSPTHLAEQYHQEAENLLKEDKHTKALILLEKANKLLLSEGKEKDVFRAEILHLMSNCYFTQDMYPKATAYNKEALDIQAELLGEAAEATLKSRLHRGLIAERLGQHHLALEDLLETLKIYTTHSVSTHSEEYGILHYAIGACYSGLRDSWQAILYYQKAAQIFERLEESTGLWKPLLYNSMGTCYWQARDSEQALHYFQQALNHFLESVGEHHQHTSMVYTNMGLEYYTLNQPHKAVPYLQKSLEILENLGKNNLIHLVDTYILVGANYSKAEDFDKAQHYLQKGLDLGLQVYDSQHPKVGHTRYMIASMYEGKEDYLPALKTCQEGLVNAISSFQDKNVYTNPPLTDIDTDNFCIQLLHRKAIGFRKYYLQDTSKGKRLEVALESVNLVIQAMEKIHYHTDQSKQSVERMYAMIYESSLETKYLIWEKKQNLKILNQAFSSAEKAKAALLLFAIRDDAAKAESLIPDALLKQVQAYKIKLTQLDKALQEQRTVKENIDLKEAKIQTLQTELLGYHLQYSQLMERLEQEYPSYFQLKYQNQTASIAQIQEKLQLGELLIEYSLYEENLFIFAIAKDSVSFKKIPRPENLEKTIDAFGKRMFMSDIEEYCRLASTLYQELLKPIEAALEGKNKLLIIPDGILQRLSFDALITPLETSIEQFSELPYLIKTFDIQYHYSATLLWYAHQKKVKEPNHSKENFLGLAPIKFGQTESANNGYILKSGKNGKKDRKLILKSGGTEQEALVDLAETETEVKTVYELFEEQEKDALALFYDMASKENLLTHIEDYKYVLLSTHGFSNAQHSTLSGLNLYENKEMNNNDSEVNKLYISDIMNLQLSADLVVLSSCESGVGKLQKGEGMMGLHRAFLYAGVQNIVYSLFKVRQDSTSLLVQHLFRHILAGDTYAAALRKAKLSLIEDQLMEPVDWAGFALIGAS